MKWFFTIVDPKGVQCEVEGDDGLAAKLKELETRFGEDATFTVFARFERTATGSPPRIQTCEGKPL